MGAANPVRCEGEILPITPLFLCAYSPLINSRIRELAHPKCVEILEPSSRYFFSKLSDTSFLMVISRHETL